MNFKRWMTLIMITVLALTGLTGCSSPAAEEGAENNEYVESTQTEEEQSLPQTVGDPTVIQDSYVAPQKETSKTEEPTKQETTTPSEETPVEETPSQEEPSTEPETPTEEQQSGTSKETSVAVDASTPNWSQSGNQEQSNTSGSGSGDSQEEETAASDPNTLKIVSYNIRCANDANGHSIKERAPRLQALLAELDPDIMGFQEVVPGWMTYLNSYFDNDYESVHRWRAASNKEGTPIYWKRSKFTLMNTGYFWLSDTPDEESKASNWGADCYRICMWVKLKVKSTGKEFLFFNTHFDYKNETCHVNSAKLVTERVKAQGGFSQYAVFCTGDFNMNPNKKGYNKMCENFADINRSLNNDTTPTYTSYGKITGSIIDYCFYSADLVQPLKYQVLNPKTNGGYPSDHSCVYVEAKLL